MLAKELVAASTEPLILSLLSKGESYGYALIQEVKRLGLAAVALTVLSMFSGLYIHRFLPNDLGGEFVT